MFNSHLLPHCPTPMWPYRVMRDGKQIGTVLGVNYAHANKKAMQLFKRNVSVERASH